MSGRLAHYAAAAVLVRLADEGARVVLTLLALQRTGSTAVGGALVAALLVPHVVAAPLVGVLTDRARRLRLVVAVAAAGFAAALGATATELGRLPLAVVVLMLLAGGCCGPALTGALTSQLPGLVPGERLPRAFGVDSLTYNGAGIVAPAAGAVIAAATSPAGATYALAASAALGAALTAALPVPTRYQRPEAGMGDLLAGARVLVRDRVLAAVTAAGRCSVRCWSPATTMPPPRCAARSSPSAPAPRSLPPRPEQPSAASSPDTPPSPCYFSSPPPVPSWPAHSVRYFFDPRPPVTHGWTAPSKSRWTYGWIG